MVPSCARNPVTSLRWRRTTASFSISTTDSSTTDASSPSSLPTAEHRAVSEPWTTPAKRRRPCSWWRRPTRRSKRRDRSWEGCSGNGCLSVAYFYRWWGMRGLSALRGPGFISVIPSQQMYWNGLVAAVVFGACCSFADDSGPPCREDAGSRGGAVMLRRRKKALFVCVCGREGRMLAERKTL